VRDRTYTIGYLKILSIRESRIFSGLPVFGIYHLLESSQADGTKEQKTCEARGNREMPVLFVQGDAFDGT
jgi:hypothetical protein